MAKNIKKFVKRVISYSKSHIWVDLLILFVLIIPTFYHLVRPGYFFMQDDLQAFRIYEMNECFKDFQIPCRWVPDAGYQYGYPQFIFYPPLVYYFGELIHLFGFQFIDSVKLLFILGYVLSAVAMYFLVKEVSRKRLSALVSSLLYAYVPYKAVEVYVRGAMSEFWALVFFPLIFLFIYKSVLSEKFRYVVFLALSIAGLLLTHLLSVFIFLIPALVWAVYWIIVEKKYERVKFLLLSGILGVGIASFYLLPVIFERKFVHMETLLMGYFDWRKHFVNLYGLFLSREWGYGSSGFPNEKLNLSVGLVQWLFAVFAGILAVLNLKKKRKVSYIILILIFTELFILFLIHPRSNFIWEKITALQWLQFPWRFLAVSIFLLSLIAGFVFSLLNKKFGMIVAVLVVVSAVFVNINYYSVRDWYDITDVDKFSGKLWEKELTISIFDYLPVYAKLPPFEKAPDKPEILEGKAEIVEYGKRSKRQFGKIIVHDRAIIRAPLFDFPGMKVFANGRIIEHRNNDCRGQKYCLGLVTFLLDRGEYNIEVKLTDTPIRKIGNILSILSLIIPAYVLFRKNEKETI